MKNKLIIIGLILACNSLFAQTVKSIHNKALVVDTHGDILSDQIHSGIDIGKKQAGGNFDLERAKEGGLDVQVFSIWCDEKSGFNRAIQEIDSLNSLIKRYPEKISFVRTAKQLKEAVEKNKMAAMIGVEGGHMIENRLDYLDSLANRGMAYMTLTWNNSIPWATSAADETKRKDSLTHIGLTDFGRKIISRMNELGVMVDLSHVGETTFYDAIAVSNKPVIASHSCAYALNPHSRNLKDDQLKAIAKTGGVVFLNFYSGFLDSTYHRRQASFFKSHAAELKTLTDQFQNKSKAQAEINRKYKHEIENLRAPLSLVIAHIDHMVKIMGVDHVGLGADFDGAESYPRQIDDVSDYPLITSALIRNGYSKKDVRKILGDNFIRVLKANKGE
ncbi:MAG TPA: dipeptidase [Sphingobacteriaceae bacterium]|nr:dipeptidase [Sphingobacteriaceae bacterium]